MESIKKIFNDVGRSYFGLACMNLLVAAGNAGIAMHNGSDIYYGLAAAWTLIAAGNFLYAYAARGQKFWPESPQP